MFVACLTQRQILVAKATQTEGFNPKGLPRRAWQSGGREERYFSMSLPLFINTRYENSVLKKQPPYKLHPWIFNAMNDDRRISANPQRPTYWDATQEGTPRRLLETNTPYLANGDLVWVSFTTSFWYGKNEWGLELKPRRIVKVGTYEQQVEELEELFDDGA